MKKKSSYYRFQWITRSEAGALIGRRRYLRLLATGKGKYRLSATDIAYKSMDITNHAEVNNIVEEFKPNILFILQQ